MPMQFENNKRKRRKIAVNASLSSSPYCNRTNERTFKVTTGNTKKNKQIRTT